MSLRALGLACLALVLLAAPTARASELTPEEEKWVRELTDGLNANSPLVRANAERALIGFGLEALPVLVEVRATMKSPAAISALLRAIRGMGMPGVIARLNALKAAGKPAPKKVDALLQELGAGGAPGAPLEIALNPVAEVDPARLPLAWLKPAVSRPAAKGVEVDVDGDGTPETPVESGTSSTIRLEGLFEKKAVVFQRAGTWWVGPGSLLAGTYDGVPIELLDADLDGRYDGPADHARVGTSAFFPLGPSRRVPWKDGRAAIEAVASQGWKLRLEPDPPPPGLDPVLVRGMTALNRWRTDHGRSPSIVDTALSLKCKRGAEYLALNAPPGSEGRQGGSPHKQDPAKPGASAEGAEAQARSIITGSADPAEAVAQFGPTMLHRIRMLGDPPGGFGIGCAPGAGGGWTLIWGPSPVVAGNAAPVVVPAPGATGVPTRIGAEHPTPDDPPDYYATPHGYPISATHGPGWTDVVFRVTQAGGTTPLPGRTWTTTSPIDKRHADNESTAFFAADEPLQKAASYEVLLTAKRGGQEVRYAWGFRTR